MPYYEVTWQTDPSPGSAFYNGTSEFFGEDESEAINKAKTKLADDLGRFKSCIVILEIKRQVKK